MSFSFDEVPEKVYMHSENLKLAVYFSPIFHISVNGAAPFPELEFSLMSCWVSLFS